MASADHIKALLKAHTDRDDDRFFAIAMQLAAHEARSGHGKLARELRDIIDAAKATPDIVQSERGGSSLSELSEFLHPSYPKVRLGDLIVSDAQSAQIRRVIREHRNVSRISEHGLSPRRKLLLVGPPGTGKTLTASIFAGELGLPLFQVRLDGLVARFGGETAARLRQIYDATTRTRAVFLFDNFEVVCSDRSSAVEANERFQVFNSFVLMIGHDTSRSLLVVATRCLGDLNDRLLSYFDDILEYAVPTQSQIVELLQMRLRRVTVEGTAWAEAACFATGLSYAEVSRAASDVLKTALISGFDQVTESEIYTMLKERKDLADKINA